jgi:transposase
VPFRGDFFDEADFEQALSDVDAQLQEIEKPHAKPPRKKRKGFSDKLLRVRIELPLSEAEKAGASQTFFTKVKEELDIIRPQTCILEYW